VIEVNGLTVRFGGVLPIDDVDLTFASGTNGLIGPNGAGKTTFFNVLSGFVRPEAGTVGAFGEDLLSILPYRRARWGLRRTFQTEQAISQMSVYENVLVALENSGGRGRRQNRQRAIDAVVFAGLGARINDRVGTLGAGERRMVELARAVVGEPRLILLDEPAAGLPEDETAALVQLIRRIPDEIGALVILVDHDMSLVSATCETTAVLDFGRLIASGATDDVLRDELVIRAYLGTEDVA
jgi:ABC-type branched-subunit amino acid transport system ATPase component